MTDFISLKIKNWQKKEKKLHHDRTYDRSHRTTAIVWQTQLKKQYHRKKK